MYAYDTPGGQVASSWPPKRKRYLSEDQKRTQELFLDAMHAMKAMDADMQTFAAEAVKGTPYLPRDLLLMCIYGRGPTIFFQDGTRAVPMAVRINISELLDNVGWEPGTMLFRGANLWIPTLPGSPGQILRYSNNNEAPVWGPPSVTGRPSQTTVYRSSDGTSSATLPRQFTFQAAQMNELNNWSLADPQKLWVPDGITSIRLTGRCTLSISSGAREAFFSFADDTGATSWIPNAATTVADHPSSGFAQMTANIITPWFTPTSTYYTMRLNVLPATAVQEGINSWFAMEAV